MSEQQREWEQSVVSAVEIRMESEGVEKTVSWLNEKRQSRDDEIRARANEGLSYVKREVLEDE